MTKKLTNDILKITTLVSGIAGLTNVDLTKSSSKLAKEKWDQAILIEDTNKGTKISIAIIVDIDVRTKVIAHEVNSSIKDFFKKINIKLDKVNIYIRGIK